MPEKKEVHSEHKVLHKETHELSSKNVLELIDSSNRLVNRMDKIISLFEEAAKHVGEVESTEAKVAALSSKLESLLEQNKAIAQGLLLLEKYVRGKSGIQQPTQMSEYS